MHGTVASDTALRCATAAHTAATMETSNSRRSVNLHGMTTCNGMLFLNGSHVKSDGLVMQFDIHERTEDATWRRKWTEAELTYPGRRWDEKDTDIYLCEAGTFIRTAPSGFCESWAKGRSKPKLTVPHCETCSSAGAVHYTRGAVWSLSHWAQRSCPVLRVQPLRVLPVTALPHEIQLPKGLQSCGNWG